MNETSFEENMANFEKRMVEMHARAELVSTLRDTMESWKRWDYYEKDGDTDLAEWQVESNRKLLIKMELVTTFINQLLA